MTTTLQAQAGPANNLITPITVDAVDLEQRVKSMYKAVAENPHAEFHFEMGRVMAERLGYAAEVLDYIPAAAIDSFAGVGYYFHYANLKAGESVIDLGSGSGMDTFYAAQLVGKRGRVVGIDMTAEQLDKSRDLLNKSDFENITYQQAYIQATECEDESFDVVISNGVFNLAPNKHAVFKEAARLLEPGGRIALADIVTNSRLPEGITCDATLWAACIGGAMQQNDYLQAIRSAGFIVEQVRDNLEYQFISDSAQGATQEFGVKSISVLARKADGQFSTI
jgi:ubiquinone/menaquinone biosynthesis C-methylase UbiE